MLFHALSIAVGALLVLKTAKDIRWGLLGISIIVGLTPEFRLPLMPNFRLEDAIFPVLFLKWLIPRARGGGFAFRRHL